MPKKTKRQKMATEKRKLHIHETINHQPSDVVELPKSAPNLQKKSVFLHETSSDNYKKDLYKSLFISLIIILVEITIYLAQNKVIPVTNLF